MDVTTTEIAAYPGAAQPEATEQPEPQAPSSITEHAEQFKPGSVQDVAVDGEDDAPAGETAEERSRRKDGTFKPGRHRAKSQQASPEDVEAINGYTKRIKETESKAGADIVQKPGESQRVYEMRRRAELLERWYGQREREAQARPAAEPQRRPEPVAQPRQEPPKSVEDPEPVEDDPKYKDDYGTYLRDQARWAARDEHRNIRKAEAEEQKAQRLAAEHEKTQKSWGDRVTAAMSKYPDFKAVAFDQPTRIPAGSMVDAWIMEHKSGADVLYTLQRDPGALDSILAMPILEQVEALTLLAQRLNPQRQAADQSGAAPAPKVVNLPPRPPTPERTEAQRASDGPPPTDGTLSVLKHAKAFMRR